MGVVFGPEDVLEGRKKMFEKASRDLEPADVKRVEQVLRKWDERSEGELIGLLGEERTKRLLRDLKIL